MMKGYKTWIGVGFIFVSAGYKAIGYDEIAAIILTVGAAIGVVGLGHKLEKNK